MPNTGPASEQPTISAAGQKGDAQTPQQDVSRFFELSLDLLCIAGYDGYFQRLNPSWERVLGYPLAELYAQPFVSFVHPEDVDATLAEAGKLSEGAGSVSFENRYRCADGSYKWLLWTSTTVPEASAIYAIARDITDRKRAEAEARNQAQLFTLILDQMADGVIVVDGSGKFIVFNPAAERLLGAAATPTNEDEWAKQYGLFQPDRVTPLSVEAIPLARALHGEPTDNIELFISHAQASQGRWATASGRPLRDAQGMLQGAIMVCRDVTEQRAAYEQAERMAAILEATTDFVGIAAVDGTATYVNRAGRAMLGFATDASLGGLQIRDIHPAWVQTIINQQGIPSALQHGAWLGETALITRQGREIPISQIIIAHKNARGEVLFLSTIGRDLSAQKQAEAERIQLQEEIIITQQAALAELSTPLIPIAEGVVVMPLIGSIDSRRAQQMIESLLNGVAELRATTIILDITGVPLVDTQVANTLLRAADAVRLLGAQVILTGIRPEVAQTLVGLGVTLSGVVTRGTLQSGIAFALARQGYDIATHARI